MAVKPIFPSRLSGPLIIFWKMGLRPNRFRINSELMEEFGTNSPDMNELVIKCGDTIAARLKRIGYGG